MLIEPEFYVRRLKDSLDAYEKARVKFERQMATLGKANRTTTRAMSARKREVDRDAIPAQISVWASANVNYDPKGRITSTDLRNTFLASDGSVFCSAKKFHRIMTELGFQSAHGGGPKIWRVSCSQSIPDRMDVEIVTLEKDPLSDDRYHVTIKIQSNRLDSPQFDLSFRNLATPAWSKFPPAVTKALWPMRQANFLLKRALKRYLQLQLDC